MANDVHESLSDVSSQKSVTDWLMHVISGRAPGDTEVPGLLHEEARSVADFPKMNGANGTNGANGAYGTNGAAPLQELPPQNGSATKASNGVVRLEEVREFTADDLCGPPAFGPVPTSKEEITADDLCWVPGRQVVENPPNWMVNVALAEEASHIETAPDAVILISDLEREAPAYAAEQRVENWEEPQKYVISSADILRESAPALVQQYSNGAAADGTAGLESHAEAMAASSTVIETAWAGEASAVVETPIAVEPEREVTPADISREAPPVEISLAPAEPLVAEAVQPVVPAEAVAEPAPVELVANAVSVSAEQAAAMPAEEMPARPELVNSVPAAQNVAVEAITKDSAEPLGVAAANTVASPPVAEIQAAGEVLGRSETKKEEAPAPMTLVPEPVNIVPAAQNAAAEAIAKDSAEPLRIVTANTVASPPIAEIQAAGEVLGKSETKKEEAPASMALVPEPKPNVVTMGAEQAASRPRANAKRMTRAKRDQVVTIADICRDWVLEEMLEKTDTGEIDDEEGLQDELEDLIEGISPQPAESVFAHEGIWGNPGRLEGAGQVEGTLSERPEQAAGLMASEGMTEVEEARPGVQSSGVKALLRLGSLLPWLARDFPVVESANKPQNNALTQEVRDEVAGMRLVQHEIRSTVHDHSLQLKRVEEQLSRVRETLVEEASETSDLVDTVKTTTKAVTMFGIGVCALLLFMLAMLLMLVMHGR